MFGRVLESTHLLLVLRQVREQVAHDSREVGRQALLGEVLHEAAPDAQRRGAQRATLQSRALGRTHAQKQRQAGSSRL